MHGKTESILMWYFVTVDLTLLSQGSWRAMQDALRYDVRFQAARASKIQ